MPVILNHPSISPELLTDKQTAALLSVSRRLVWILAKQGDLKPVRFRGCTRWRRTDVLRYINGLEEAGNA